MNTPRTSSPPPLRSSGEQLRGDPVRRQPSLQASTPATYVLSLADDALIAAQRMGEWIASAPQIEEDVALGNIALDLLGQARSLLTYAGSLSDPPLTEDDLAYWRDEREFRNVHLVERRNGDFAVAVARLLLLSTYLRELYARLARSTDETLSAIAAKAVKEVDYHRDHATMWVLRLGDGTVLLGAGCGSDDVSTTSKSVPVSRPSVWRASFDQCRFGAPETYQGEPLSARIIP